MTRTSTRWSDDWDRRRALDELLRQRVTAWTASDQSVEEYLGLYVSDREVHNLLFRTSEDEDNTDSLSPSGEDDNRTSVQLARLASRFSLTSRDIDILTVALAPELDTAYETVYAYLQDDATRRRPTVGFVIDLLGEDAESRLELRRHLEPSAPLRAARLVTLREPDPPESLHSRALTLDERIVDFLYGSDAIDSRLAERATISRPNGRADDADTVGNDIAFRNDDRTVLDRLLTNDSSAGVYVRGRACTGTQTIATAIAASAATPLLSLDAMEFAGERDLAMERLALFTREGTLQGATLHVRGFDALEERRQHSVLDVLAFYREPIVLSGERRLRYRSDTPLSVVTIELTVPTYPVRRRLWRQSLRGAGIEANHGGVPVDITGLARAFRLTVEQIRSAVRMATASHVEPDRLTDELYAACRAQSAGALENLAQRVDPTYTWDDIVLPADRLAHLREVSARVKHRSQVQTEWGFGERYGTGRGIVALFSGPSGTGKTMAADIVASDAGLPLYKIDLSTVVSKYIGETEKNLGAIFDAGTDTDAILLFDEADALFGKRSDVRDAHDRYANVEVNYLLQRIEAYDGIVILTTNLRRNMDDAFTRRIHLSVDFPLPERELRNRIWSSAFPSATPVGRVDSEYLSRFELSGGQIRNVALGAAFLAADEDEPIEMTHVVRALARESQKAGKLVLPEEFEPYREDLHNHHVHT